MRLHALLLTACTAVATLLLPSTAEACGGFFCSNDPIDQSGEDIVFDIGEGKVEAHVGIAYQGSAKDFSWVVPVHGVPTLKVSSPQFLQYMKQITQPTFQLQWEQNTCFNNRFAFAEDSSASPPTANAGGGGVTVLSQGQVGPYDSVVLAASSRQALATWLQNNGYNLADPAVLDPYIGSDFNFLALKLQQDKDVGDLRPIAIDFGGARPCIPIRLTAVAARPDMPITAYIFAQSRAVPVNYRHVLINETRVDWVNYGTNYNQVASRAVDEAGGRAFLTEYAGPSAPFAEPQTWQLAGPDLKPSALTVHTHPVEFTEALFAQNYPRGDAAIFAMFQKYIPLPKSLEGNVTPQQFYNSMDQYRSAIDNDPNRMMFDAAGFANDLQTVIVDPLMHARALLKKRPYLTRLYTTMSADEMTVDPEFDFNTSAPEVKKDHTAKAEATCNLDGSPAKVTITLEDGRKYEVDYSNGALNEGPYAERVEQYSEQGPPALISDNAKTIDQVVLKFGGSVAGDTGCGCTSSTGAAAVGPISAMVMFALASLRLRRRKP